MNQNPPPCSCTSLILPSLTSPYTVSNNQNNRAAATLRAQCNRDRMMKTHNTHTDTQSLRIVVVVVENSHDCGGVIGWRFREASSSNNNMYICTNTRNYTCAGGEERWPVGWPLLIAGNLRARPPRDFRKSEGHGARFRSSLPGEEWGGEDEVFALRTRGFSEKRKEVWQFSVVKFLSRGLLVVNCGFRMYRWDKWVWRLSYIYRDGSSGFTRWV